MVTSHWAQWRGNHGDGRHVDPRKALCEKLDVPICLMVKLVNNTLSMERERERKGRPVLTNAKCYLVQTFISMLGLDE